MPINILGTKDKPQYLETVFYLFQQLHLNVLGYEDVEFNEDEILCDAIRKTSAFKNFNDFLTLNFELQNELKTRFLEYNESKLQDRYGNTILPSLVKIAIPTYNKINSEYKRINSIRGEGAFLNEEKEKVRQDSFFLIHVLIRLSEWLDTICTNIQLFTPELYERNKVTIESFVPILDLTARVRMPPADQDPSPPEGDNSRNTTKPRPDQMSSLTGCVSTFTDISFRVSLLGAFGVDLCKDRLNPNTVKELKDFVHADELNDLLAEYFASRNETALQQTYAKVLIENLLNDWLPVLKTITGEIAHLQHFTFTELKVSETGELIHVVKDLSGPEFSAISENIQELWELYYTLVRYNQRIINQIRQFAPNLYNQNLATFQEYISTERPKPESSISKSGGFVQPETKTIKPSVKLQWNGDKTDLAELVWALTKSSQIIDPSTNKPVITSELTRQFEILFGIEKLDVDGLVSKRIRNTYKSADGKTFMDTLQRLMKERITTALKK